MALFGGSSSDSSPSSAGTQVQDDGFGFSLSGRFKNSDLTVVQSDHESISAAFSFADRSIGDSLALVDNAVGDALMFAEMVNDDIIQTVNDSRDAALEFGAGAFMEASETSRMATQAAMDAAAHAADSAASASRASSKASRAAIESAQGAFNDSLYAVGSMATDAFGLTKDGYNSALSAVGGAYGLSIDAITDTTGLAIETATNSTRSEASRSFDQLVKIAAGAAVGIVALYVLLGN